MENKIISNDTDTDPDVESRPMSLTLAAAVQSPNHSSSLCENTSDNKGKKKLTMKVFGLSKENGKEKVRILRFQLDGDKTVEELVKNAFGRMKLAEDQFDWTICCTIKDEIVELDPMEPVEAGIEYSLNLENQLSRKRFNKAGESESPQFSVHDIYIFPRQTFKVVFAGDSGVGKSGFLQRYCNNHFNPLSQTTISMDIMQKTLAVHDQLVSLHLWDTAGQERLQYLLKKSSFMNIRNWIKWAWENGIDDECVFCLVGNKVDLGCRAIKSKDGKKLANEFDMLFFETSAFTGEGIELCMQALASRIQLLDVDVEQQAGELVKLEFLESITTNAEKKTWKCCPFFLN